MRTPEEDQVRDQAAFHNKALDMADRVAGVSDHHDEAEAYDMRFEGNTRPAWLRDSDIIAVRHYTHGSISLQVRGDGGYPFDTTERSTLVWGDPRLFAFEVETPVDWSKPIETTSGLPARIVSLTDGPPKRPIVIVIGESSVWCVDPLGRGIVNPAPLRNVPVPQPRVTYANVYQDGVGASNPDLEQVKAARLLAERDHLCTLKLIDGKPVEIVAWS